MTDESKVPDRFWLLEPDIFDGMSLWQNAPSPDGRSIPGVREDVAKAMVATAMENAAQILSANVSATVKAEAIRALIRDDALAALERVREKAREEGRQEEIERSYRATLTMPFR